VSMWWRVYNCHLWMLQDFSFDPPKG
jgi:hypothetical protein